MRKSQKVFIIANLFAAFLLGLAIILFPELQVFLNLKDNSGSVLIIIITGALLVIQFFLLLKGKPGNLVWISGALASLSAYVLCYYFFENDFVSSAALPLTFISFGMQACNLVLTLAFRPFWKEATDLRVGFPLSLLWLVASALIYFPFFETASFFDKWFLEVEEIVFIRTGETFVGEELSEIEAKYEVRVNLRKGKRHRIMLSDLDFQEEYNLMLLEPQTLPFTYRNFQGEITLENGIPDDMLMIEKQADLQPYSTGSTNYSIISCNHRSVYFNLQQSLLGKIDIGGDIGRIYLNTTGEFGNKSHSFSLTVAAENPRICLSNMMVSANHHFLTLESQNAVLLAFGRNSIWGNIYTDGDLTLVVSGIYYQKGMYAPAVQARNLEIKGTGEASIYGYSGTKGFESSFEGYDGGRGSDGQPAISVLEKAVIESENILIAGGNGGQGGKGSDSIPGLFVRGGDGGEGGNGAPGIIAKEVRINKNARIMGGKGGAGGAGGKVNGIGWEGSPGKPGKDGEAVVLRGQGQ